MVAEMWWHQWPLMLRARHEATLEIHAAELGSLRARAVRAENDAEYWRTRCEKLIDQQLLRADTVPVMQAPEPPDGLDQVAPLAGMFMSEVPRETATHEM